MAKRAKESIDPARLRPDQVAAMLSRVGEREISAADVEADIVAGAPANEDGSISLVYYGAWLAREVE